MDCCCETPQWSDSSCFSLVNDFGVIPDDPSPNTCRHNTDILTKVLSEHASNATLCLAPAGTTLFFYHGVVADNLQNSVLILNGAFHLQRDFSENPFKENLLNGKPAPFLYFKGGTNITLTSTSQSSSSCQTHESVDFSGAMGSNEIVNLEEAETFSITNETFSTFPPTSATTTNENRGLIYGNGPQWWGIPFEGYLELVEYRPRLVVFQESTDVLFENIVLQDAPFYNVQLHSVNRVEMRHLSIISRRVSSSASPSSPAHGLLDLSAFNTDGIDVSGHNIHIHHCDIWTQDDCIAVKDNNIPMPFEGNGTDSESPLYLSSNMTFEHITASGLGLVIGSIGRTSVRNITFQNSYLYRSFKGIYFKFRPHDIYPEHHRPGSVEDIVIQNVTMEAPQQWPIWIGPAQQAVNRNPCHASPCSLCWPFVPLAQCNVVEDALYRNIRLSNIQINNPLKATGVLMGGSDEHNPRIHGLIMENVRVTFDNSNALLDPTLLFPGLSYPVDDPYIRYGLEWVVGLCVGLGVCIAFSCVFVRCNRRRKKGKSHAKEYFRLSSYRENTDESTDDGKDKGRDALCRMETFSSDESDSQEDSQSQSQDSLSEYDYSRDVMFGCAQAFLFMLLLLLSLLCAWWWYVQSRTRNVTHYYVCEGISDGVALGNTWPVPHCLKDETTTSGPEGSKDYYSSSMSWQYKLTLLFLEASIAFGAFRVGSACSSRMQAIRNKLQIDADD